MGGNKLEPLRFGDGIEVVRFSRVVQAIERDASADLSRIDVGDWIRRVDDISIRKGAGFFGRRNRVKAVEYGGII